MAKKKSEIDAGKGFKRIYFVASAIWILAWVQLAKQLERQNNMQQSQFLFELGQQLLTPQAPASLSKTNTCTIRPLGTNTTTINCF